MLLAMTFASTLALAQRSASDIPSRTISKPQAVQYLYPEQVTLPAGKPSTIALHFRVAQGLHINSHNPSEEEFIPTTLSFENGSGVTLDKAVYPPGADFTLPLDPNSKLSVYTGEFTIQARVVATAGNHLVQARLRYQACDSNACLPPKTMNAAIDVIGN